MSTVLLTRKPGHVVYIHPAISHRRVAPTSLSLLLLSLPLPGKDEAAVPFVHPGLLHSQAEIDFVRTRIRAGKEPWKTAWKHLKSHDLTSLERKSRKGYFLLFQIRSVKGSWKLVAEYLD